MDKKWNMITFGGVNSKKSSLEMIADLDDEGLSSTCINTKDDNYLIYTASQNIEHRLNIYAWLIKNIKSLNVLPEWAVISTGNKEDMCGNAWIIQNYKGYMDIIDVAIGQEKLYGVDVEKYILNEHGISIPVWRPENLVDGISIESNVKNINKISDGVLEEALKNFPQFNKRRKISGDRNSKTNEKRREHPLKEERSVELSDREYTMFQEMIREYTVIAEEKFISSNFTDENTFIGTWIEFTNTFWNALDKVKNGVDDFDIRDSEKTKIKNFADKLKWQSAIDWHKLYSNDEYITTSTRS
jgi:hypothetical protein